jgi:hypothetical protein
MSWWAVSDVILLVVLVYDIWKLEKKVEELENKLWIEKLK